MTHFCDQLEDWTKDGRLNGDHCGSTLGSDVTDRTSHHYVGCCPSPQTASSFLFCGLPEIIDLKLLYTCVCQVQVLHIF